MRQKLNYVSVFVVIALVLIVILTPSHVNADTENTSFNPGKESSDKSNFIPVSEKIIPPIVPIIGKEY